SQLPKPGFNALGDCAKIAEATDGSRRIARNDEVRVTDGCHLKLLERRGAPDGRPSISVFERVIHLDVVQPYAAPWLHAARLPSSCGNDPSMLPTLRRSAARGRRGATA